MVFRKNESKQQFTLSDDTCAKAERRRFYTNKIPLKERALRLKLTFPQ